MTRNFYFQRADGTFRKLAENVTEQEAMVIMHRFLDEHNFKSYYTQITEHKDYNIYDVGSWSEFFYWGEPNVTINET